MPLVTLTGGAFQDIIGNPVSFGTMVLELTNSEPEQGDLYESLSPLLVCEGLIKKFPLDANGNVAALSPANQVYANDHLFPPNSYYKVTVYTAEGQRVWGTNSQQVLYNLSPVTDTFDCGQWVPNEITET